MYLQSSTFDWELQTTAELESYVENRWLSDDEKAWYLERLTEAAAAWREYNGQINYLQCAWFKDGVGHFLRLVATWFMDYREATGDTLDEANEVKQERRRVTTEEEALTHARLAAQLVNHPRFPGARSDEKRRYMAEQQFPDHDELDPKAIVSLAQLMYWWDVEPTLNASKAEKARQLREHGESIKNIAAILEMSEAKVRLALDEPEKGLSSTRQSAFDVE